MNFSLPDDAAAIGEGLRTVLAEECPPEVVRAAWPGGDHGRVEKLWRSLGEIGALGLLVPEDAGGLGFDEIYLAVSMEQIGYVGAPGPLLETAAVVAPLLGESGDALGLLADIVAGTSLATCQLSPGAPVPFAQVADVFVLGSGEELVVVQRQDVEVVAIETTDGARRAGTVTQKGTATTIATPRLDEIWNRGVLAASAQLVGLSARMLDMTTTYVLNRHQFGVAIGSFQAIKHALANALIAIEFARPAVLRAALSMAENDAVRDAHVSMAKAMASNAARRVAATAIQSHGAMGYTVEYDLHLFAKRAWALAADWGSPEWHMARIGKSLGVL